MIKVDLVFLLVTVSALHLDHQQVEKTYNATNYYNDLGTRQNQFKSDINIIKSQIDQINRILNTSALTSSQKISTLSEGMADQRDSLYKIQTYLNMPFEIQPCQPVNLTAQQRSTLQQKIDSVNNSLNNLQGKVNVCLDCPQVAYYQQILKKQYNYLRVIQATINSNCLKRPYQFINEEPTGLVNIAYSIYKDNLKAPNWVYGNITEQQYKKYIFPLTTQYNLTSCPLVTPFFDTVAKKCIICRGIFSIGQRKCIPCPDNQYYNTTVRKCIDMPKACPAGTILNETTDNCDPILCSEGLKLDLNTYKCVSICQPNQFYNTTSKSCQYPPCERGQTYNITLNKCQPIVCPVNQTFNLDANACIDIVKNTFSGCPPERPIWNSVNLRCQQCPIDFPIFNRLQGKCEPCPPGTAWNSSIKSCIIQCQPSQVYNWNTKKCEPRCFEGQLFNLSSGNCYNQCTQAQVYNKTSKLCDNKCGLTYKWDIVLQKCVCKDGLIFINDSCVEKAICPYQTPVWNSTSNTCYACPISAPILKNGSCESCPSKFPLYSPILKQCVGNCSKGYFWNNSTYSCDLIVCPIDRPLLNFTTGKCSSCPNGFVWLSSQKTCKSNFSTLCPSSDKPFYNPETNTCQMCPLGTVFNSTHKLCQYCPTGSHLDDTQSKCIFLETCQTNPSLCPQCPQGYVYNHTIGQCIAKVQKTCETDPSLCPKCPQGYIYNNTIGQCISKVQKTCENDPSLCPKCPQGYVYNNTIGQCIAKVQKTCETDPSLCPKCPQGYTYNQTTGQCTTTIEKNTCPDGFIYNQTSKLCYKCQVGTVYDKNLNKCTKIVCEGGVFNANTQKCQACPSGTFFDSTRKSCLVCPNGTHYIPSRNGCIKCPQNSTFDTRTQACHACQAGSIYNPQTGLCHVFGCNAGFYYSLKQKNCIIIPTCQPNQYFSLSSEACTDNPICKANQVFNSATKQCQLIPTCPDEYYYNRRTNQCEKVGYVTAANATNLIYAYNFSNYIQQYNAKLAADPSTRDCPKASPFYDRNKKICVSCPTDRPYFNLHTSLCQNCGEGSYDATLRQCKLAGQAANLDPTLERLIMNII